jgi:hypothetical protein
VGSVENTDTVGAEFFDEIEEAVGVLLRERGGGLVENENAGVAAEGAGDFDELFFGHAQLFRGRVEIQMPRCARGIPVLWRGHGARNHRAILGDAKAVTERSLKSVGFW